MIKELFLLILFVFGLFYSILIYSYGGFYFSFVLILITIGFASTFYSIDKKISYRIVFYIWIVIIIIATITLLLNWVFNLADLLNI